ncbi:MAG: Gfo/Idh/MocA family oxidoreductase [Chthoniobacterales bacterium]
MSEQLRVGVVGVGHIGSFHARIYSELESCILASVFDDNPNSAVYAARKFNTKATTSLEEFASAVDAATISTPTSTHYVIGKFLLERGKHLLIEKPITDTTAQALELADLAHSKGCILQVGHVERFNPVLDALEERLTQPRFLEATRLSPYPNRSTDIGVVLDLMIHDLEIILHLVRSPIKSIDAVGIPVLSKGEDIANVRIRFENGCVANITASRISTEKVRKIRVFQENAYLSLDYQKQAAKMYRLTEDKKIVKEKVRIRKDEPLKRELAAFIQCAKDGVRPKVSGHEAAAALEAALEITRQIEAADPRKQQTQ